jgi:hypothetical protein
MICDPTIEAICDAENCGDTIELSLTRTGRG